MDPRRKKKSGARQWILAAAVAVLAVAVVPLLNYFKELKAIRAEVPMIPAPKAIAAVPIAAPTPTPAPTQAPKLSQPALDSMIATAIERGAYEIPLRNAEYRAKLELSDDEHRRLLDDVMDLEHVREELEQSLVAVESFNGTTLALKIPAYPEQGKMLRAALVAQVGQDFPPDRAAEITASFDTSMEELFGGFGRFTQTFTVTMLDGDDGRFQITFAGALADSAEAPDSKTDLELAQMTGNGSADRGGLLNQWKAIGPQILSHFPPKSQPAAPTGAPGSP